MKKIIFLFVFFTVSLLFLSAEDNGLLPEDIFRMKTVVDIAPSPDGRLLAINVRRERDLQDEPGPAYNELYLYNLKTAELKLMVGGKQNLSRIGWTADSKYISFLSRRQSERNQLWLISATGGEAFPLSGVGRSINNYSFSTDGKQLALSAEEEDGKREQQLKKLGFNFIFFEENLKPLNLYIVDFKPDGQISSPQKLTSDLTVRDFFFSPNGKSIYFSAIKENLIDHDYMFKDLYCYDLNTKSYRLVVDHPGKFGSAEINERGDLFIYTASLHINDHAISQAYLLPVQGKEAQRLIPPGFQGHIEQALWLNNDEILIRAAEGVWNNLYRLNLRTNNWKKIFSGKDSQILLSAFWPIKNMKTDFVFIGSRFNQPPTAYLYSSGKLKKLFELNGWLEKRKFAPQEVIRYPARDGLEIEAILVYPLNYQPNKKYPLVVSVHGGPEAHNSNGWLNSYFLPPQILASRQYLVLLPNYRASTGYGVDFAMQGFSDAGGKEFDDIADGITYLIEKGLVDREKVAVCGGSYGGYAAAWFATYYTRMTKAAIVFVGISNLISKRLTTDIPQEEVLVHSGKPIEEMWQQNLQRSPIYWAHQSKTATLIVGGKDDPRVHPAQGLELFRIMKLNGHPAVRLIYYPGEGHGNQKQQSRWDLLLRHLQWLDYYLLAGHTIADPLPPLDISNSYGVLENENSKN